LTGNVMGTPAFMSPEQARGKWEEVDARSDLWAVGATMFTLLSGRLVHDADNINMLLLAAMTKQASKIREVAPSVPAPLAEIVDRARRFEPNDRWPDAASMRDAVRGVRTMSINEPRPPAPVVPSVAATPATTMLAVEPMARTPGQQNTLGPT